jgi:hypothetical protein
VRPCGACRSLVPADTGCEHWAPGLSARAVEGRERRARQREERAERRRKVDEEMAAFRRVFRLGSA